MDFFFKENRDGIRFSGNYWPTTIIVAQNFIVPTAFLYTTLKEIEGM